ncbi:hypothetical protein AGR1A_Lc30013 [Agrobacterium fabacearum CFBP 5771]|nr:hypothetical protein AGR1A_Lc30013 [Agrobacterium fabacearum CFBP 5771]
MGTNRFILNSTMTGDGSKIGTVGKKRRNFTFGRRQPKQMMKHVI